MIKKLFGWILLGLLLLGPGHVLADPDLRLQDTSERTGPWAEVYAEILREKSGEIQAYQEYVLSVTSLPVCRPVGLTDLTGDGVPELIFLSLSENTEYGFKTGRLWIYTPERDGVRCVLTLQPEIDDLLYSRYYLSEDGRLTIHLSDVEKGWILRLLRNIRGYYEPEAILVEQADFSGEGPDEYFLDGKKISKKKYQSLAAEIAAAEGAPIGSLMVDDGGAGFSLTPEEAADLLFSGKLPQTESGTESSESPISGLPELSFSPVSFDPGQKFAVYSAPSSRSWRGAKGKAAITSGSEIFVAGAEEDWILILYELDSGVARAGYIDSWKISGSLPSVDALSFPRLRMTLSKNTVMTDDPIRQKSSVGRLKKGAAVTCLARYRGWIYAEAKVSGKTARGFIPASSLIP